MLFIMCMSYLIQQHAHALVNTHALASLPLAFHCLQATKSYVGPRNEARHPLFSV